MTEARRYGVRSLRFKLVLASVVVEALMLTVLVWNSTRITGDALAELFQHRVETLVPMMNASLVDPLAQRDYATLEERLDRIVHEESLVYVEVRDELGQLAARRGKVTETAQLDTSFEVSDRVYDQVFDITLAGEVIGRARYGLNVSLIEAALTSLRNQGVLVAAAEIVLTALLLVTVGVLLTRHLQALAQAAGRFAGGDYGARVPVTGRDEVADTAQAFNTMAEALAHDIAIRERVEAALRESSRQLQTLSRRILDAQEAERRRLARDLHDELGQALTAIKINLQARDRLKGQSPAELDAENIELIESAIQQVRQLALALRPSMLDDLGLLPALRWIADQAAERGGFSVQLGADFPDTRLAAVIETVCFRIVQETLTNIARHAQAKRVAIELRHDGDTLLMTVQDDGRGFDVAAAHARATAGDSFGMLGMQERAELVGGKLEIESAPGQGTVVRARFPWQAAGEQA